MSPENVSDQPTVPQDAAAEYEAPKVESVLTADELAREIQYAGISIA